MEFNENDIREKEDAYIVKISKASGFPVFKGTEWDVKLANRIRWYWFKKIVESKALSIYKESAKGVIASKLTPQWWIARREESAINLLPVIARRGIV